LGSNAQNGANHQMGLSSIAHKVGHIAALTLTNPIGIGTLSLLLVFVPIIGMHLVHKYGWEHWEPFAHEPHT
jgi:hypothetical protein